MMGLCWSKHSSWISHFCVTNSLQLPDWWSVTENVTDSIKNSYQIMSCHCWEGRKWPLCGLAFKYDAPISALMDKITSVRRTLCTVKLNRGAGPPWLQLPQRIFMSPIFCMLPCLLPSKMLTSIGRSGDKTTQWCIVRLAFLPVMWEDSDKEEHGNILEPFVLRNFKSLQNPFL